MFSPVGPVVGETRVVNEKPVRSVVTVEAVRLIVVITFTSLGYRIARAIVEVDSGRILLGAIVGSGVGYVAGGMLGRTVERLAYGVERRVAQVAGADLVAGVLSLLAGTFAAGLVAWPLLFLPTREVGVAALALVLVVSAFLGWRIGLAKREDLLQLFGLSWRTRASDLKVIDTSAALDPRLLDCVRAGFIRGTLLLPSFVMEEVQSISDAGDPLRRTRGRRALEMLTALGREGLVDLRPIDDRTFPEYREVDAKVVALARERGGAIVTNDVALGRVAELQGIEVLSLHVLSEAMRVPVVPGEQLRVRIQKEGREAGQGVGYLDDGTMVVVEGASALVGADAKVSVTSVVQTSGGRMIFARRTGSEEAR